MSNCNGKIVRVLLETMTTYTLNSFPDFPFFAAKDDMNCILRMLDQLIRHRTAECYEIAVTTFTAMIGKFAEGMAAADIITLIRLGITP